MRGKLLLSQSTKSLAPTLRPLDLDGPGQGLLFFKVIKGEL